MPANTGKKWFIFCVGCITLKVGFRKSELAEIDEIGAQESQSPNPWECEPPMGMKPMGFTWDLPAKMMILSIFLQEMMDNP